MARVPKSYSTPALSCVLFFQLRTREASSVRAAAQTGSEKVMAIVCSLAQLVYCASKVSVSPAIGLSATPPASHIGLGTFVSAPEDVFRPRRLMFSMVISPESFTFDSVRYVAPRLIQSAGLIRRPKVAPKPQPLTSRTCWPRLMSAGATATLPVGGAAGLTTTNWPHCSSLKKP